MFVWSWTGKRSPRCSKRAARSSRSRARRAARVDRRVLGQQARSDARARAAARRRVAGSSGSELAGAGRGRADDPRDRRAARRRRDTTVRHWLAEVRTQDAARARLAETAPAGPPAPRRPRRTVRATGWTTFVRAGADGFRCALCRTEAVQRAAPRGQARSWSRRRAELRALRVRPLAGGPALPSSSIRPTKAFAVTRQGVTRSLAAARAEARKCVLLCSNCHAEVEAGTAHLPASLLL